MLLFSNIVFCLVCLLIFFTGLFLVFIYIFRLLLVVFTYFFPAVTSCHKLFIIISNFTGFKFESLLGFIFNVIRAFLNYFIALNVCNSPVSRSRVYSFSFGVNK